MRISPSFAAILALIFGSAQDLRLTAPQALPTVSPGSEEWEKNVVSRFRRPWHLGAPTYPDHLSCERLGAVRPAGAVCEADDTQCHIPSAEAPGRQTVTPSDRVDAYRPMWHSPRYRCGEGALIGKAPSWIQR